MKPLPRPRETRSEFAGDCPACGGSRAQWQFFAKGIPEGEKPFSIYRCAGCALGWTAPAPPEHEIGRWYPAAYYGKENVRFNWLIELLVRLFRNRRAGMIRRMAAPGPVLDVGCGRGMILGYLKSFGYSPYGVEISDDAAWHARRRMGVSVHVGNFLTSPFGPDFFNAVIFWHSLEHLRRPIAALAHAHALLKKGGLLIVAVPNSESLQARLSGRNWFHLDVPRHYFHFGLESLTKAVTDAGFRVVDTAHFSFEQNPYGWLQSLFNMLGFKFNFLYDVIKTRSSRLTPLRSRPLQALAMLALLPILVPLAVALTALEAALRRGGTIEVYAVKR